jgi:hypothetical protein
MKLVSHFQKFVSMNKLATLFFMWQTLCFRINFYVVLIEISRERKNNIVKVVYTTTVENPIIGTHTEKGSVLHPSCSTQHTTQSSIQRQQSSQTSSSSSSFVIAVVLLITCSLCFENDHIHWTLGCVVKIVVVFKVYIQKVCLNYSENPAVQ